MFSETFYTVALVAVVAATVGAVFGYILKHLQDNKWIKQAHSDGYRDGYIKGYHDANVKASVYVAKQRTKWALEGEKNGYEKARQQYARELGPLSADYEKQKLMKHIANSTYGVKLLSAREVEELMQQERLSGCVGGDDVSFSF